MSGEITLFFKGPFSWPGTDDSPSIFDVYERRGAGVYLFTVPLDDGHLVYYVGETGRNFGVRLLEHYKEHAAAMYHVCAPAEFSRGVKRVLWPGRFDASDRKSPKECIAQYLRLCEPICEMTRILRFLVAPTSCDARLRRRIEAAIALALYDVPGAVGEFQDRGVRHDSRRSDEEPVELIIESTVPLLGLPRRLSA